MFYTPPRNGLKDKDKDNDKDKRMPVRATELPETFEPAEGLDLGWEDCTLEFDGSAHKTMNALNFGKKKLPVSTQRAHLYHNLSVML